MMKAFHRNVQNVSEFPPNWVNLDEIFRFPCKSFLSATALMQQYLTHHLQRQQEWFLESLQSFLGLISDDKCSFWRPNPMRKRTAAGSAAMDTRYQV